MGSTSYVQGREERLVAVLLVTRSRPGPKLVFHYPAHPTHTNQKNFQRARPLWEENSDDSETSDDEDDEDEDEDEDEDPDEVAVTTGDALERNVSSADLQSLIADGLQAQPVSRLFDYTVDSLEKLLAPDVWSDRHKFEVALDDLTFVGHPVHSNKEGQWLRANQGPEIAESNLDTSVETLKRSPENANDDDAPERTSSATKPIGISPLAVETTRKEAHDFTHIPESLDSQLETSLGTSLNSTSSVSDHNRDRLSMFNVVFVYPTGSIPSTNLYHGVVKKLSKALTYCQRQTSYVATEIRKIMAVRSKLKPEHQDPEQLVRDILATSELARGLKEIYDAISRDEIASFTLNGNRMSLTVVSPDDRNVEDHGMRPEAHQTLLLLDRKDKLLCELANADASPLAVFIREQTPTKSFQKHAMRLGVPLDDVLYLAQHLLHWRKARLISPLRPSNIYTVNPEADLETIKERAPYYNTHFMALPSLALMLKVLSGRPIKYVMLIPSRDHREHYMDMLSCLVRDGLVIQLKTYGWLSGRLGERTMLRPVDRTIAQSHPTPTSLLSPHLRPVEDDSASVSSGRTTIQRSITPITGIGIDHKVNKRMVILDPESTSPDEERLIEQITGTIHDTEVRDLLPLLIPYFNGEQALEDISARKGLKRASVDRAIDILEQDKHLLTYRSA